MNNEEMVSVIDVLLCYLTENNRIHKNDDVYLMGLGYGAHLAATLLVSMADAYPNLKGTLLINGFLEIDADIQKTCEEWINSYTNVPNDVPEVHLAHYYVMSMIQEKTTLLLDKDWLEKKVEMNPIKIEGRLFILKGMLESRSIKKKFADIQTPIYAIHSLHNYIVKSSHAEEIVNIKTPQIEPESTNNINSTLDPKLSKFGQKASENLPPSPSKQKETRKLFYYLGGHDIIDVRLNFEFG